ncbi:cytochrome c [uncultured Vibrio sp.]|uniref:c-type cytochrome n=1 Tax=uncultured Vibrio sp. TaxID=114054 RepID=UPI0025E0A6CF|nr:cytochrome c [uncultured Vibrio sp.]
MYRTLLFLLKTMSTFALFTSISTAQSDFGDISLGKQKSPSCIFCHGANGIAPNSSYPNINGQDPLYLYNAMKAYQDGHRTGPLSEMMKAQLQRLNDEDLRDVAAYFSSAK